MTDSMSISSISDDEKDILPMKRIKKNSKKEEIKVFLRIRPQDNLDKKGPIGVNEDERCLQGVSNDEYLNSRIDEFRGLQFNTIFKENCSQDEFYQEVISPILPDIFHKQKSSLIFAYGVTNSGKTHSIIGQKQGKNQQGDGILPRVLHFLVETKRQIKQQLLQKVDFNYDAPFQSNANRIYEVLNIDGVQIDLNNFINHHHNSLLKLSDISIFFENFEIYNEEIFDLQTIQQSSQPQQIHFNNFSNYPYSQSQTLDLKKEKKSASKRNTSQKNKLKIKEKYNKKVYIKDLVTNEIEKSEQISWLIKNAIENRQVNNNNINQSSSRSQCCFKIRVKFIYTNAFNAQEEEASLLILDLAGAERAKKTNNTGSKMAESCHINKTLLCLGNCIRALRNGDENVPYRESKLTRILNEYFLDQNNVLMIVHIHPGISYTEENINVLKYAAMGLEAKLKAAAPIYEGTSKYSFLMESAQKSTRHDKSYTSNMSYDKRSLYRDYQSMDQDQIFAQIGNIIYNGSQQNDIYGERNIFNYENQQILGNLNDGQNHYNGAFYDNQRALEEKQKQFENKFRELELREIILNQKKSIEYFDLQFENFINEEQNKLKLGQSLFNQFKIPDQIMYGYLTEDEVNQQYANSIKKNHYQSDQNEQREIARVSEKILSKYSQKNQPQQQTVQVGGGFGNSSQKTENTSIQIKESVKSNLSDNIPEINSQNNNQQNDICYIRENDSINQSKINQENIPFNQQSLNKTFTPNSILSQKENYLQTSNHSSKNLSTSNKHIDNNINSPQKFMQNNQQQLILSQKTEIDNVARQSLELQQSFRKNTDYQQNSLKKALQPLFSQSKLNQNNFPDLNIQQVQKHMDVENEGVKLYKQENILDNENNQMNSDNKQMINEEYQSTSEEQYKFQELHSQSQQKVFKQSKRKSNSKRKMIDENEFQDKNSGRKSVIVKGVNIQEYIESIYESSTKKVLSEMMEDEVDQSNQLLESLHIYEGSDDCENEVNQTAPNSINSMVNLDDKKFSLASDITSVSQQLIRLKLQQDKERLNLQMTLENGEEQLRKQLEVDINEQQLKKEILIQSEKLMKLIKDQEDISEQKKYYEVERDNKQKEDERKMNQFQEWMNQIQSEMRVQQRLLEQKEAIIQQQQEELAALQFNIQEKQRIQQVQINQSLQASEAIKEKMYQQELKLKEEAEKTAKLQEKLSQEIKILIREHTQLGQIENKKTEIIKSQQATAHKQKPQNTKTEMEVEQTYNSNNQMICEDPLSNSNILSYQQDGKTNIITPKKNDFNISGFNNINGKSYAEKQIQTSVYRSTKPQQNNSNTNTQGRSDVSTYAYYTYSESEQVPQRQSNNNNKNSSLGNTQNSQSQPSNTIINLSNKNKFKNNTTQPKVKTNLNGNLSQFQAQNKNQCSSQNTQTNSQEMKEEDQMEKNSQSQKSNSTDQASQKDERNSNQKKLSEKQKNMVDEKDEILTQQQQQQNENIQQNEDEDDEEDKNMESKRQRGRRKNNTKQTKKSKKATSKERNQETSIDSSTSKDSNTINDIEVTGKPNIEEITSNEDLESMIESNDANKGNKKRGKSKQKRESVLSNRSTSRHSNASVKSNTSSSGQNQQKNKKQKGKINQQKKYDTEKDEVSEEEASKKEGSKKENNNNKKKPKNRK